MTDIIIIAIVAAIIAAAAGYIYKAKKQDKKCIGCPNACTCSASSKEGGCGCGGGETDKNSCCH